MSNESTQPGPRVVKGVLFTLICIPALLVVFTMGGLGIWVGVNSVSSGRAQVSTTTGVLTRRRSQIRFTGPAARVQGVGMICFGIWFCTEAVLMGGSVLVNEIILDRKSNQRNYFRQISLIVRVVMGVVLGGSFVLALALHIAGMFRG